MTADYCPTHQRHTCRCPRRAYGDPRTGGRVYVITYPRTVRGLKIGASQ